MPQNGQATEGEEMRLKIAYIFVGFFVIFGVTDQICTKLNSAGQNNEKIYVIDNCFPPNFSETIGGERIQFVIRETSNEKLIFKKGSGMTVFGRDDLLLEIAKRNELRANDSIFHQSEYKIQTVSVNSV